MNGGMSGMMGEDVWDDGGMSGMIGEDVWDDGGGCLG